jgi:hypothetical protein
MIDVVTEIVIERPREAVAAFTADPGNATVWYANIRSAEWLTPPPMSVGTRILFRARFMGRALAYAYEVKQWVPGERLVMFTSEGPFPMETSYEWISLSPNTAKMRLRNRGGPSGIAGLFAPIMALVVRRENRKDLVRLKQHLESTTRGL